MRTRIPVSNNLYVMWHKGVKQFNMTESQNNLIILNAIKNTSCNQLPYTALYYRLQGIAKSSQLTPWSILNHHLRMFFKSRTIITTDFFGLYSGNGLPRLYVCLNIYFSMLCMQREPSPGAHRYRGKAS